ncbi:MAG: TIGR00282 family metallophosphoesterase [Deltaproteobacteria bacterium]|nr:TIGR00282 family metallophosphoesterase [Deltaproteobacteria bacterium]
MSALIKILFIGDIVGRPGRTALRELLPGLIKEYSPDIVIANGENSAGGFGITPEICRELRSLRIDIITTGNHVWDKKEIIDFLNDKENGYIIRPANYPEGAPGSGAAIHALGFGVKVGVLNLSGRVFMDSIDCPFRAGKAALRRLREETPVIIVDMHAETTSEKTAMAWYLDGSVSAVVGTHTHVQTSDERILPNGTAFITDAGMTGPTESVIGVEKDIIIDTFLTKMPSRFEVASKGVELQGVFITVGPEDGRARTIERIKVPL